ncbi:MAG: hypothetical protein LBQ88_14165 [Treponema sp.]|nr:hypothetical protein [Treponema sp.]
MGWAYCAADAERDYALLYLEKDCPSPVIRGFPPNASYRLFRFDPSVGQWLDRNETLATDGVGRAPLPAPPLGEDVGIKLIRDLKSPKAE